MKREYGQALRTIVERRLRDSAFAWEPVSIRSMYVFPGERVFRRSGVDALTCWCVLVPHQKFEHFTFDVGWSRLGRFPELSVRPFPERPEAALSREESFARLGDIAFGEDRWWEVEQFSPALTIEELAASMQRISADEARRRVEPLAVEAVSVLEAHGIPYLERAARTRAG